MKKIHYTKLKPGMLVIHESWDQRTSDPLLVIEGDGEIKLISLEGNGITEVMEEEEDYGWMVVGKVPFIDVVKGMIFWEWNEEFPPEELQKILRDNKRKIVDCIEVDTESSTACLLLTSREVSKDEAKVLYLKMIPNGILKDVEW